MRVAICISGQPRGLPRSLDLLKFGLLNRNKDVDLFIHSWFDDNVVGAGFDSAQPSNISRIGAFHPNTKEYLLSLSPKSFLLETPKSFSEFNHLSDLDTAKQKSLASMFYSAFKCNELKKEYEEKNNFKYDIVIKTRLDLEYATEININDLNLGNIDSSLFVARKYQYTRVNDSYPSKAGFNYSSMSDTWILGSSKNIDIVTSIYQQFESVYNSIYPYVYGEAYLGYVVRGVNNIPVSMLDIDYHIYRGS